MHQGVYRFLLGPVLKVWLADHFMPHQPRAELQSVRHPSRRDCLASQSPTCRLSVRIRRVLEPPQLVPPVGKPAGVVCALAGLLLGHARLDTVLGVYSRKLAT